MSDRDQVSNRRQLLKGFGRSAAAAALVASAPVAAAQAAASMVEDAAVSYFGNHQPGIVSKQQSFGLVVSFDCLAENKAGLERLFRLLTDRSIALMKGGRAPEVDAHFPQPDSGIMGRNITSDGLKLTVSVGASLFDARFGLADKKPARLKPMEQFPNDALEEPMCHGDMLIQFCANQQDTLIHALRDIIKNTPDLLAPRWKMEGFLKAESQRQTDEKTARNMLGFKDGTGNPAAADNALMDQLVWAKPNQEGEPAWIDGGSYHVVRLIRNFVERWDRTPLGDQEKFIGRHKYSGAPLGKKNEFDEPDFATSPQTSITPNDAHIRLANARTPETLATRILRRGFNYSLGLSRAGQLDMGLLFICFQANLDTGFRAVQQRLNGEQLEEYIKPFGGGYFFALPGVANEKAYLGQALIEA